MPLFDSRIDVQRYALIQYVQENYKEVTLSDLSEKFHYSNEYTSRLIKELTGMTYTEILRTVRIERSQDLLANSTMSVATIAEAVGYDTTEHYIRQFKKHTKIRLIERSLHPVGTGKRPYRNFSGSVTPKSFASCLKLSVVMVCLLIPVIERVLTSISADFSTVCIRPKVRSKSSPAANIP